MKPLRRDVMHALSFDIEDWFHIVEVEAVSDPEKWPEYSSIVVDRTLWILDLLNEYEYKATFFLLGWVAKRYPQIARAIADAGHELGTHSFWHGRVYELTPETFRQDMRQSIDVIQDQSGQRVRGFRAPSFSITPGTEWALDVLLDLGLEYDASLFPAVRGHGGYPCAHEPHQMTTPSGRQIPELPMSVRRWGPLSLPFSGGGYLRVLPQRIIHSSFDVFERRQRPAVIYLHPRDFDPHCPRVPMPLKRRFKCYVGLKTTEGKLRSLLAGRRFGTCAAVLESWGLLKGQSEQSGRSQQPISEQVMPSPLSHD